MDNVIQIADQTFISANPTTVRASFDSLSWEDLWPDLDCTITQDRENLGMRWKISGALQGTMELWFEPRLEGVLLHFFLHGNSLNLQRKSSRKLVYLPQQSTFPFHWYVKNFRFTWNQHGVRRNARKIAYDIKIGAEKI